MLVSFCTEKTLINAVEINGISLDSENCTKHIVALGQITGPPPAVSALL